MKSGGWIAVTFRFGKLLRYCDHSLERIRTSFVHGAVLPADGGRIAV